MYWARPPSAKLSARYGQPFADLAGTLDVFESADVDLVEMVLTNDDDWDRYAASQWLNVANWLDANPDQPDAAAVRAPSVTSPASVTWRTSAALWVGVSSLAGRASELVDLVITSAGNG